MKKNWGIYAKRILVTALTLSMLGGSVDMSGFTVSAQTTQEEVTQTEATPGKAAQGESAQEKAAQGESAQEKAAEGEAAQEKETQGETSQEKQKTVTVTGFAELPENIREQQLPVGAQESDICLPESLTVTVERTVAEDQEGDAGEQDGTEEDGNPEKEDETEENTGSGEQGGTEGNTGLEGQGRNGEAGDVAGQQGAAGQDNAAQENGNNSTDNGQNAGEQDGYGEGLVSRIADWFFAPMTVHAAENPAGEDTEAGTEQNAGQQDAQGTTEEVCLAGITWELNPDESDAEEFDAGEAADGFCYVYTPVLPDTDKDGNTLAVGDDVELPAIYVLVGEPQLALLTAGDVAEVTVNNGTPTTHTTVNDAIDTIQTAINNASGDTLDIGLTFLEDRAVTGLDYALDGKGKTVQLTIDMNEKTVGIDRENNGDYEDFKLDITNIKTTLTGTGTLSATVNLKAGAELTVKDEITFRETLTIKKGGKATLEKWEKGEGSFRGYIVIEDGGSCTITGGTYDKIRVESGAELEVSGNTAEITTLYADPSVENSTVKRAEIKLSGGTYNTISYPNGINQSYLEDPTYRCAIVDMLASGYSFYDSKDNKTVRTPERTAIELKDVKVLTEPEVIVSFQITKTDGTTQQKDFSTWNEAMSYLSEPGDETKFADWNKVEILLKKDASISERVDPISDRLSAELVLRSEGDTIHTLFGTNPFSSLTALHINGQKLTVEKINLSNAYVKAVEGTVTIKNKADLKATGGQLM